MYSSNDFEGIPDIKFEEEVNGDKVAARGEQTGVIYINLEELLGKTPTEVVSILVHESVHSEKITQSSGSKLTEEIFVKDKESQVKDKFKEEQEELSEKEQKEQEEYLAKLDKENEDLREYSEDLEADSFNEEVEGYDPDAKDLKKNNVKNGNSAKDYKISYLPTAKEYLNALLDDTLIVEGKGPLKIPVQAINNLMNVIGVSGKPLTAFINNEILIKFASSKDKNGNVVFDEAKFKASLENVETFGLVMAQIGPQLQGLKISKNGKGTTNVVEEQKLLEYNNQNQKLLEWNGKYSSLPENVVDDYLNKALNNETSKKVLLGTTGSYDKIADKNGYTYFKMSDDTWNSLEATTGKNYDEIWKVNKAFLNKQIEQKKTILLSNDPNAGYYFDNKTPRFYQRELDYLKEKGYKFEKTSDNLWKAIKK